MAPSVSAHSTGGFKATSGSATALAASAGDVLVVFIAIHGANSVSTVSDGTNTYSLQRAISNGTATRIECWAAANVSAGTFTVTVTFTSTTQCSLGVVAVTGVASSPVDAVGAGSTGTSAAPGDAVTTVTDGDLLLIGAATGVSSTFASSAATLIDTHAYKSGPNYASMGDGQEAQATHGAITPTLSISSTAWAAVSIALKPAAAPASFFVGMYY